MNVPILVGTIIIELIIIGGVSWVLGMVSKSKMSAEEFTNSNRSMPAIAVGATQALTCLGGGSHHGHGRRQLGVWRGHLLVCPVLRLHADHHALFHRPLDPPLWIHHHQSVVCKNV